MMIENYKKDKKVTYLLDTYDWLFVPVVNPDGYKFALSLDPMWRKNRRPDNIKAKCFGVDLNRNFNFKFGWNGFSDDPCNKETFHGVEGKPEPETRAISSFLCTVGKRLFAMVTVHTTANVVIHPWGHTIHKLAVAQATAKAMGPKYNAGSICDIIAPISASSVDYAKSVCGVKYAFGVELVGTAFKETRDKIPASFTRLWNGVVAMEQAILKKPPF